jgi:hypothetical protein
VMGEPNRLSPFVVVVVVVVVVVAVTAAFP